MKEANEFESWAQGVTEGIWALPDSPEAEQALRDLMREPLPVGADATNVTAQLYDILGDDELFDRLEQLAQQDSEADARPLIQDRLEELGVQIDFETAPEEQQEPDLETDPDLGEDLDTDGVMMTRPSNMSSESRTVDLDRLRRLALYGS
jgi:hypothetical protein